MDIRSISCLFAVMVFIIVPFTNSQSAASANNTGQKNTTTTTSLAVVAGGNKTGAGTGKNGTGTMTGTGTGGTGTGTGGTGTGTGTGKNGTGTMTGTGTGGTGTGTGGTGTGGSRTVAPKVTPKPSIQCVNGSCTVKGDDESCFKDMQGRCPSVSPGGCTKDVIKNTTHTTVTVGCSSSVCAKPGTPTTSTAKPSTTSTSTCCTTDLCNQYSAAASLTTNMLYAIGLILINVYM